MPAPPRPNPPNHVARLAVTGLNFNLPWANVFWIRNGNGSKPSDTAFQALCSYLGLSYSGRFKGLLHTSIQIVDVEGIYYSGDDNNIAASAAVNVAGIDTGAALPAQVSTCISWKVHAAYKGGHPRTYLPPPPADEQLGANQWTTAFTEEVRTSANFFHQDLNGLSQGELSDLHLGTVSFVLRKQWRNPPVFRDY